MSIHLENITKHYGRGGRHQALAPLDLDIHQAS